MLLFECEKVIKLSVILYFNLFLLIMYSISTDTVTIFVFIGFISNIVWRTAFGRMWNNIVKNNGLKLILLK